MRILLPVLLALPACAAAWALDLPPRSVSTSKQFIVFCRDTNLRSQVTTFAEQTKSEVLQLLEQSDEWKAPIVISIAERAAGNRATPPSRVQVFNSEDGMKFQIDVVLGGDPAAVALHSQLIRALLLEYAYRGRTLKQGESYDEPPQWLVEGMAERMRRRITEGRADVFQALIEGNRLPSIGTVLTSAPGEPGSTWSEVFRAYSMALVELLIDRPGGRASLARFVQDSGRSELGPVALLVQHFPGLGDTAESLEKWWALSMAQLSAGDRYEGLTAVETDHRLEALLTMEFPGKPGEAATSLRIEDFRAVLLRRDSRKVLEGKLQQLMALSARANALFRPVIGEYQEILASLAREKTDEIAARLYRVAGYRKELLNRIDKIADYLNWMEATKMKTRSNSFDAYFKAAQEEEKHEKVARTDPVSRYMNLVEALHR